MGRSAFCWIAFVLLMLGSSSSAFVPSAPRRHIHRDQSNGQSLTPRRMVDQNKGNNDDRSIEEVEREASRKVASSLMFTWNLQEALTKTAWTFVLVGFILNIFGYDYVFDKDNLSLRIDTIENKQFQQEVVKASKNRYE